MSEALVREKPGPEPELKFNFRSCVLQVLKSERPELEVLDPKRKGKYLQSKYM